MHKIYSSQLIIDNHQRFIDTCYEIERLLKDEFKDAADTTWIYNKYNIFSYSCSNIFFYDLYRDLCKYIREYVGDDRRIWIQAWLNFLTYEEVENVLSTHGHDWDLHGYISIDPKETTTEFTEFAIKNKIGNIYLGPCTAGYDHRVINDSVWDGKRITIGFDCTFCENHQYNNILYPIL
tara:strand:+ start:83 stop:619 length:537 start_codon:yes stop_codon:yes gene_type:complete